MTISKLIDLYGDDHVWSGSIPKKICVILYYKNVDTEKILSDLGIPFLEYARIFKNKGRPNERVIVGCIIDDKHKTKYEKYIQKLNITPQVMRIKCDF